MEHQHHTHPIAGVLISVFFTVLSGAMEILHTIDGAFLSPLLHVMQIGASTLAILSASCVIYPPLKDKIFEFLNPKNQDHGKKNRP